MIRLADISKDFSIIYNGARDFISRMDHPECIGADDELAEAVGNIVSLPGFECWLDEEDVVNGGIGLLFCPPIWLPRRLAMTELFIWARTDAPKITFLRLMRQAMKRKEELGVSYTEFMSLSSSPPGIAKVYEALGCQKMQETWIKVD